MVRKVSFNGRTSLVEVTPLHGRTHQIRLHLQFLGHPIANDAAYGGTLHYGDAAGGIAEEDPLLFHKGSSSTVGNADAAAGGDLSSQPPSSSSAASSSSSSSSSSSETATTTTTSSGGGDEQWYSTPRGDGETAESFVERTCRFCRAGSRPRFCGEVAATATASSGKEGDSDAAAAAAATAAPRNKDSRKHFCACIWLHAFRYERRDLETPERDWAYQTALPTWASPGFAC